MEESCYLRNTFWFFVQGTILEMLLRKLLKIKLILCVTRILWHWKKNIFSWVQKRLKHFRVLRSVLNSTILPISTGLVRNIFCNCTIKLCFKFKFTIGHHKHEILLEEMKIQFIQNKTEGRGEHEEGVGRGRWYVRAFNLILPICQQVSTSVLIRPKSSSKVLLGATVFLLCWLLFVFLFMSETFPPVLS